MTATPYRERLALILYGDLDISVIDSLPPGRQQIDTFAVNTGYRERYYNFIDKELEKGRQAYIICAMVEENENVEAESVTEYATALKNTVLRKRNIAVIHGKMKPAEKEAALKNFCRRLNRYTCCNNRHRGWNKCSQRYRYGDRKRRKIRTFTATSVKRASRQRRGKVILYTGFRQ